MKSPDCSPAAQCPVSASAVDANVPDDPLALDVVAYIGAARTCTNSDGSATTDLSHGANATTNAPHTATCAADNTTGAGGATGAGAGAAAGVGVGEAAGTTDDEDGDVDGDGDPPAGADGDGATDTGVGDGSGAPDPTAVGDDTGLGDPNGLGDATGAAVGETACSSWSGTANTVAVSTPVFKLFRTGTTEASAHTGATTALPAPVTAGANTPHNGNASTDNRSAKFAPYNDRHGA